MDLSYPSETETRELVNKINQYIKKQLNQPHSSIDEHWVAEALYTQYRLAIQACKKSDHQTISKHVFNTAQSRINTLYTEHERHLKDIKDISRPNEKGLIDSMDTSVMPIDRGEWVHNKGNDTGNIWFRQSIKINI